MDDRDPRPMLVMLADARGDSLAALSAMLGRNAAYLQQFVRRGTPRRLAERDRQRLADYFGVSETVLGAEHRPAAMHIRRLDVAASAGPGAAVDAEITVGTETLAPELARRLGLREGAAAILRVRGDSMMPGLMDGDHIVVDEADRTPGAGGGIYVVRIGDGLMVKRVARRGDGLAVSSDNPSAPSVPAGAVTVIGRVVWQMRAPR